MPGKESKNLLCATRGVGGGESRSQGKTGNMTGEIRTDSDSFVRKEATMTGPPGGSDFLRTRAIGSSRKKKRSIIEQDSLSRKGMRLGEAIVF